MATFPAFLLALSLLHMAAHVQARGGTSVEPFIYAYVPSPSYTRAAYESTGYPPPPHRRHHHHHRRHKATSTVPKQLHTQAAVVTGNVFCDICKNGQLKEPLKGVTIGITCWNGKVEQSFFAITDKQGNFKVKLSGYNTHKQGGGKSCRAKLIYPSVKTLCMLPTNLNDGKLGAPLRIKSQTSHKLVLLAGPFAYTTPTKNKKCHHKGRRFPYSHKQYKTNPSPYHIELRQHAKYKSPSCPVLYDCKSKTPPFNLASTVSLTQRKIEFAPLNKEKYKASSPQSQSFKNFPIYFIPNKDHKSRKNTHSSIFSSY